MFENNPWNLPEGNFTYLIDLLKREQVNLSSVPVSQDSAIVELEQSQLYENDRVVSLNKTREDWKGEKPIIPRIMSLDLYTHGAIIMRSHNTTRRITFSTPNHDRLKDGSLVRNPVFEFIENLSDEASDVYCLACFVYMACCFWKDFIDNDIGVDTWSKNRVTKMKNVCLVEKYGKYYSSVFHYNSDICQSLIDVFGQEETEDLIKEFIPNVLSVVQKRND